LTEVKSGKARKCAVKSL